VSANALGAVTKRSQPGLLCIGRGGVLEVRMEDRPARDLPHSRGHQHRTFHLQVNEQINEQANRRALVEQRFGARLPNQSTADVRRAKGRNSCGVSGIGFDIAWAAW